ncbi:protein GRIM REAPER-like [Juglans microcarpa x Juglans regia]|uniref:protein GRIM REAPER-like n=1 Tax=Juglans microcarpa x Juglans regia TaxID=2249226 RepID=UPI001B7F0999|nr:protein GRIM REAPER-like [Juglans microcarpa x Juglans regia]
MACTLLKFTTILISLLLALQPQIAFSNDDIEDDEEYYHVVNSPLPINLRSSRSRPFLATVVKNGSSCNPITRNVCNGIPANKDARLLYCCKKHCRNVLGDQNNCGKCGKKCKQGERCCNGICTDVTRNANHCGKCNKKCARGFCGYV